MPSDSEGSPKVIRSAPVSRSCPTVERSSPSSTIAMDLRIDPRASTTAKARPAVISAAYSEGPNSSATRVSGTARAAMITVATQPAKNEPSAAMPSAAPARPCFAIWCPSMVVTTDVTSPGMLTRMAVVEPPYCAP